MSYPANMPAVGLIAHILLPSQMLRPWLQNHHPISSGSRYNNLQYIADSAGNREHYY